MASHDGCVEVVRFEVGSGRSEVLIAADQREVADFSVSRDGRRIAALISDPTHPYEVYACEGGQERQLSHENDAFLESVEIMPGEPFAFISSDGAASGGQIGAWNGSIASWTGSTGFSLSGERALDP